MFRRAPKIEREQPATLPDGLVAESRGARLVRRNGRLECECPFACLAVSEPCEFAGKDYK